jgi:uncharacterized protein YegL
MTEKNDSEAIIDEGRFQNRGTKPPPEARGEWTDITFILDRSGSMGKMRDTAIEGFNKFLAEQQKEPGWATLTLVLFNTTYDVLYNGAPLSTVKPLNTSTYVPDGGTSLLDALGKAITEAQGRIESTAKEDRPAKVLFAILTDGEENSSRQYRFEQIQKMIEAQQECGWPFLYLAADQKSLAAGAALKIDQGTSFQYKGASTLGTAAAFNAYSDVVGAVRRSRGADSRSVVRGLSMSVKKTLDVDEDADEVPPVVSEPLVVKPGRLDVIRDWRLKK